MLPDILKRIEELAFELEKSAAHHNGLIGAMHELKKLYNDAVSAKPVVEAAEAAVAEIVADVEAVVDAA